jgi:hypothetical protein
MSHLEKAIDKITIDMLEGLTYGDTIELNSEFELYRYFDDYIVVIKLSRKNQEEVLQVNWNVADNEIVFEVLDDELFEELINKK